MTTRKEKLSDNVQVNFNHSKEILYWSQKFNVTPLAFQKTFQQYGNSISKTLNHYNCQIK